MNKTAFVNKYYNFCIKKTISSKYLYIKENEIFSFNKAYIFLEEKNNNVIPTLNFILFLETKPTVLRPIQNSSGIKQPKMISKKKGYRLSKIISKWYKSNLMSLTPWKRYCKITKKFVKIINWHFFSYKNEFRNNYMEKFPISFSFPIKKGTLSSKLFFLQNLNLIKRKRK